MPVGSPRLPSHIASLPFASPSPPPFSILHLLTSTSITYMSFPYEQKRLRVWRARGASPEALRGGMRGVREECVPSSGESTEVVRYIEDASAPTCRLQQGTPRSSLPFFLLSLYSLRLSLPHLIFFASSNPSFTLLPIFLTFVN